MMSRKLSVLCSVSALALITACASSPPRNEAVFDPAGSTSHAVTYGNVTGIEIVSVASRSSGGGAILGAVLGGVLGHQIGGGSGRDAATVVGAVGGAVIGSQVERRNKRDGEIYRVTVRLDNGRVAQFDYERIDDLRVGDRVKLQDGQLHRA
ncbi:MAG: glycine zipper 2TM domain-containing protein [Rubrivivax sp.]|nr:glycine zipper 2TM domain-containing protein [Rubrivivax sp.]